jgi:rubrerythrin
MKPSYLVRWVMGETKTKKGLSQIWQSDVFHACQSRMWHCTACRKDWCMAEEPVFCPLCGARPELVKLK